MNIKPDTILESIVEIYDYQNKFCGYGVAFNNDYILTCTHILLSAFECKKYTYDVLSNKIIYIRSIYSTKRIKSKVVYTESPIDTQNKIEVDDTDVAILKVLDQDDNLKTTVLYSPTPNIQVFIKIDEEAYTFTGCSHKTMYNDKLLVIESDKRKFIKGDSGKPIINEFGQLCGIVSTSPNESNYDFAYCIGEKTLQKFNNHLSTKGLKKIKDIDKYVENNEDEKLFELLHNYGRSWIEHKSHKKYFLEKLEFIIETYCDTKSHLWATYLWSIHEMFTNISLYNDDNQLELFSSSSIIESYKYDFQELFLAEHIEFQRKIGKSIVNMLDSVNMLKFSLDNLHKREGIENYSYEKRYSIATATFILAKIYKNGGLLKESKQYFQISKNWYKKRILSHDNEIAHCDYMISILTLVTHPQNDINIPHVNENNATFIDGLNMMIIAHKLWIDNEYEEALEKIKSAENIFENIGYFDYKQKCVTLHNTFKCCIALNDDNKTEAFKYDIDEHFDAIQYIVNQDEGKFSEFKEWFSKQDPLRLITILQFSKFGDKDNRLNEKLTSKCFLSIENNLKIKKGAQLNATSFSSAINQLKTRLDLNTVDRMPLILTG